MKVHAFYCIVLTSLIGGYFFYQNSNQQEILFNENVGTASFSVSSNPIATSTIKEVKETGGVAFKKFKLTAPSK